MSKFLRAAMMASILLAPTAPALSQTQPLRAGVDYMSISVLPGTECACIANGTFFQKGEQACVRSPNGSKRIAMCGMNQNVLHWQLSEVSCPES